MNTIPCYADGRSYRGLHSRFSGRPRPFDCSRDRVLAITSPALAWSRLWQIADTTLLQRGYGGNTRRLYRAVLRRFAAFAGGTPAQATSATVTAFVRDVDRRNGSWAWTGMNISVLRTVFDKIGGRKIVTGLRTPKRPQRLPEILDRGAVRRILAAGQTTRDQLLLGVLYGCGLKPSEARGLRWGDVDVAQKHLRVRSGRNTRERRVKLPPDLLPVLELGVARCSPADFVFQGRRAGTALSIRRMELIVREAVAAAGLGAGITAMALRHAFAIHCLEEGASPRALQKALGHESLNTTLEYRRCLLPSEIAAPEDGTTGVESLLSRVQAETVSVESDTGKPVTPDCVTDKVEAASCTPPALFDQPLSVAAIELPLRDDTGNSLLEKAAAFYQALKTHIFGRFLGLRRATVASG